MSEDKKKPKEKALSRPYSYHTFIFPFIWNQDGKISMKQFEKCKHPCWVEEKWEDAPFDKERYGQYCYFNEPTRKLIFPQKEVQDATVHSFCFDFGKLIQKTGDAQESDWLKSPKDERNPVRYIIEKDIYRYNPKTKKDEISEHFHASLPVNGIRLKLFTTGVGIIVFELENYTCPDEKLINRINEFGRRVFAPYLDPDNRCSVCADEISLVYPKGKVAARISGRAPEKNSDVRVMEPILFLLRGEEYSATTNPSPSKKEFYIEPIIDDRMFVACAWNSDTFVKEMSEQVEGEYAYLADAKNKAPDADDSAARRLYELMFVDGTGTSCYSRTMLHDMLTEHIYHRWIECGTITGITEFSMITVTNFFPGITSFLMMYIEMAIVVLAQRASLLAFDRQISNCARGKRRIEQLHQSYILFQSKMLLRELTPQQQGIEMYDLLKKNLFIDKEESDLEDQIESLFALENSISERSDNWLLFTLAALGIVETVDILLQAEGIWNGILSAAGVIVLIALFCFNHRKRLR